MKKRIIALMLAALMIISLAACTTSPDGEKTADTEQIIDGTVEVVVLSHPSWPTSDESKAWEYIREGTGADIDVIEIPGSEIVTKMTVMFAAPDLLPDLMTFDYKPATDTYMQQGALIALDDYADVMPNYTAYVNSFTEEEYNSVITTRKAIDGKIYLSPTHGREGMNGVRAWMYREDIFDKHNLKVPTTQEELFEVCRKLKELYPDSYPFSIRDGLNNIQIMGSEWKPYFEADAYYNFDTETWHYGPAEDTMLEVIKFYKQMIEEKLAPADLLTINTNTWQELVASGRGFIFPDYQTRIDFFTPLGKKNIGEEFCMTAMKPPVMNKETGASMIANCIYDSYGYVVCNTGDEKCITNAMKFLDWFYTEEAEQLLSWGKEGETYEVVDGKKRYITDEKGSLPDTLYGFSLAGTVARFDPEAVDAFESEHISKTRDMVLEHTMPSINPKSWIALSDEERDFVADKGTEITTYMKEMVSKFILGQEPLSGFEVYQKTLAEMGVDEMLKIYETAYNRVK